MKFEEAIKLLVNVIVLIAFAGVILGWSVETIDVVIDFIIPIGISFALSGLVGQLIEAFGGSFLKKISIPIKIWKIRFSISAFFITIMILKLLLFK